MDRIKTIQSFVQKAKAEGVYTHMIPKNAYVTSVVIPMALGATATAFLAKGIYNLSTGTGKLD